MAALLDRGAVRGAFDRLTPPAPVMDDMIDLVIDSTRALAPRIAEFSLRASSGGVLPTFSAGAHVEIETGAGWRAYSLLDVPPSPWIYRIAVERLDDGAGGSVWMHRRSVGDRLSRAGRTTISRCPTAPTPAC